jgi:glutamyl-tRNA(Gln) amidotransferase subunit D
MPKPGDRVSIVAKDETVQGVLLPEEKDFVIVKLDSGYNIGVDKKRVKDIKLVEAHHAKEPATKAVAHKNGLPRITILHTGGTIASKVDYETGAVTSRFTPDEILALFPELRDIANIDSRLIRNMASDDMRFAHYNLLAHEVAKEIAKGVNGVIITHGTDTMHYSSAALSFALHNLPIPVILVGAQRSSDRGSSDAGANLIAAASFIANTEFVGVGVCMHENLNDTSCLILQGTKCRKLHSSRRDAFRPINALPWASVDVKSKKVIWLRTDYPRKGTGTFVVKPFKETLQVGLLHIHTNMYAEQFSLYKGWDGLVLSGTGLGHIPMNEIDAETKEHTKILTALKGVIASGTLVAMATQTLFGEVDMNVYAPGRKLQELGVLGNLTDMHPETAFLKLAWLLSNHPKAEAQARYGANIAGELSERIEPNAFLWR